MGKTFERQREAWLYCGLSHPTVFVTLWSTLSYQLSPSSSLSLLFLFVIKKETIKTCNNNACLHHDDQFDGRSRSSSESSSDQSDDSTTVTEEYLQRIRDTVVDEMLNDPNSLHMMAYNVCYEYT